MNGTSASSDDKDTNGVGDLSLLRLLQAADLSRYEPKLRSDLKLRHAGDIQYVEEVDLTGIGMSRPEQKRLRKEYERLYPNGIFGKLKKVFARGESGDKRESLMSRDDQQGDQHVIPIEKITLCKELGKGEFGAVWQATWKGASNGSEDMQVAVKCVAQDKLVASSSSFLQEAAIMTRMRHENVVRLFGVVLDTKRVMMVSELATCGSLLECLHKPALRDSFPVHVLCDYAEQIAKGMAYLESQRLIHRDLAARNVLVFSPKKVKISDFGLSRSLGVGEDYYRSEFSPTLKLPIAWCAPECINFLKFTSSSDVWAFGVTLWEMFTYGEMPWNGMTGAEILEAVDRERRHLIRPPCCPDDMFEVMLECWTHAPVDRPTFAQLVVQFPERLPQTVRTITDFRDGVMDHLQFKKDDLITVIDRAPASYPDGFYWFGSLRSGKTGLFKPADTVAHLGAECPSTTVLTGCVGGTVEKKEEKDKKNIKKIKEEEREKRKAMISTPIGDVVHTSHLGIDGSAFGLLQLDKKEIVPPSSSPSNRRSVPSSGASPSISQVSASPVLLRSDPMREGVPLRETMSMRDVGPLRDVASPPQSRAPSQPPMKAARTNVQPSAPPLTNSAANSMNKDMQEVFDHLNESVRSLEKFSPSFSMAPLVLDDEFLTVSRRGHSAKPVSAVYARPTQSSVKVTSSAVRTMTDDELMRWQDKQNREHKKVEYKLSDQNRKGSARNTLHDNQYVNPASDDASKPKLASEWSPEAQEAYKLLVECGNNLSSPVTSPISSAVNTLDRRDKRIIVTENKVSPTPPPRPVTPPRTEIESVTSYSPQKRVHIIETKLLDGPARGMTPHLDTPNPPGLPPKGENRLPPGLPPKMRQVPVMIDGRSLNYDNLNGVGAGRLPPPVPPKPKVSFRPSSTSPPPLSNPPKDGDSPGCAPAIARGTLFSTNKKEEIVKF